MRQTMTGEDFVLAALAIVDESGLDALNTRALGERLGVHSTSVYRHFRDWDSLLVAVSDQLLGRLAAEVIPMALAAEGPRQTLFILSMALREAANERPEIGRLLMSLLEADPNVPTPNADRWTMAVVDQLRAMGLSGEALTTAHQACESVGIGLVIFDFAGDPDNLRNRQGRRRAVPIPEFMVSAASPEAVAANNQRAFVLAVNAVLDAVEALGKG